MKEFRQGFRTVIFTPSAAQADTDSTRAATKNINFFIFVRYLAFSPRGVTTKQAQYKMKTHFFHQKSHFSHPQCSTKPLRTPDVCAPRQTLQWSECQQKQFGHKTLLKWLAKRRFCERLLERFCVQTIVPSHRGRGATRSLSWCLPPTTQASCRARCRRRVPRARVSSS